MSRNEMVSVPRQQLKAWQERFSKAQIFKESTEVQSVLDQPAEQHQGEPVGEVVAFGKGLHEIAWAAGRMPKLGAKLYTSADSGEVERLREQYEKLWSDFVKLDDENETLRLGMKGDYDLDAWLDFAQKSKGLRAQLAERDAHPIRALSAEAYSTLVGMVEFCLSQRTCMGMDEGFKSYEPEVEHDFVKELRSFVTLSASAEPSAPIAWHVGGNGYDRICFEEPTGLPGHPCIHALHDQRQLIKLLKRYDLRDEDA